MKGVFNGLLIALSMYSKIPVPQAEWNERNMRYALCFFPLVGAIIGGIGYGLYYLFDWLGLPPLLIAAFVVLLPVLVTGGIHLDGFCDTVDAISSRQPRERKLEILKDSHAGAFAIIWCAVYFVAYFAAAGTLTLQTYAVFALAYTFERAFSALSIINFRSAKEGLASTFKNSGSRAAVNAVCVLWLVAAAAGCILLSPVLGAIVVGCGVAAYLLCVAVIFKTFGGMSGDLAGWLLQVIELVMLLAAAIGGFYLC